MNIDETVTYEWFSNTQQNFRHLILSRHINVMIVSLIS